jgi:hypothetical protein
VFWGASRGDLAEQPIAELEARLIDVARWLASGTYELLVLVGECDARGNWATWGALSCAAWLAEVCDIEICTARTHVRVAHAMRQWPALDAAMRNGDVSYAKARTLTPHLTDTNIGDLVDIATRTPAGKLGAAIAAWTHRHEPDHVIAARQHAARSCTWRTDPDAMITITARLEPAIAAAICAVIDHHTTITAAPPGTTLAQQRADALATTITSTAPTGAGAGITQTAPAGTGNGTPASSGTRTGPPEPGTGTTTATAPAGAGTRPGPPEPGTTTPTASRVTTEMVIHVRGDGNTLTNGTPITDHAITRLLPDAFISLLIHDTHRHPIDASPRRRSPTRRQRRVLDARSPECDHPGCHATTYLQYDHITRYTDGGPTTINNLQRLCGPHNRAREPARAPAREPVRAPAEEPARPETTRT